MVYISERTNEKKDEPHDDDMKCHVHLHYMLLSALRVIVTLQRQGECTARNQPKSRERATKMSEEVEANVPVFLSFNSLGVKIGDREILRNVSGKVHPGELLAVMGPSGK